MTEFDSIENYGVVGNLDTCALVSRRGSIDWLPTPHVESSSVFARILDANGGRFAVEPSGEYESEQRYRDQTNVLETEFRTDEGTATLTDFMPTYEAEDGHGPRKAVYRRVQCEDGSVELDVTFEPRLDYARADTTVEHDEVRLRASASGTNGDSESIDLWFEGGADAFTVDPEGPRATATVDLDAGDVRRFALGFDDGGVGSAETCERTLDETVEYWRDWAHDCPESGCVFGGPWHDAAVRSGLALKLLTHHESGAIAAAPTTSLPEDVGGVRNWDYRYNWIRDAAFTVQALTNLGHEDEAREYFGWFLDICHVDEPDVIQPLYGLHGDTDLREKELRHLSGYRDSRPVRIGNEAAEQQQLDIYGELLLGIDEMVRGGMDIDSDDWAAVSEIVEFVADSWNEPDASIWEVRCDPQHFVFSKVMCWAAIDRGLAIADREGFDAPTDRWQSARESIREAVLEQGVHEEGHFVRAFDEPDAVDASALLIPFVGFLPFDDERVRATVDVVEDRLGRGSGLVERYEGADGLPGEEGAFLLCSFWLVDALALSGDVEAAEERFEQLLDYANSLGLLSEEVDPASGDQQGNFPQGFSHIGLINSALYLGLLDGEENPGVEPIGTALGEGTPVPNR